MNCFLLLNLHTHRTLQWWFGKKSLPTASSCPETPVRSPVIQFNPELSTWRKGQIPQVTVAVPPDYLMQMPTGDNRLLSMLLTDRSQIQAPTASPWVGLICWHISQNSGKQLLTFSSLLQRIQMRSQTGEMHRLKYRARVLFFQVGPISHFSTRPTAWGSSKRTGQESFQGWPHRMYFHSTTLIEH